MSRLLDLDIPHGGLRLKPYRDTRNKPTMGAVDIISLILYPLLEHGTAAPVSPIYRDPILEE